MNKNTIQCAIISNQVNQLRLLLELGGNTEELDKNGSTPLANASFYGYTECARLLLDYGAKMNIRNQWNIDDVCYASANGRHETLALLIARGADIHALYPNDVGTQSQSNLLISVIEGSFHDNLNASKQDQDFVKTAQVLLENGINIDHQDAFGATALRITGWDVSPCSIDLAVLLLEYKANPAIEDVDGKSFLKNADFEFVKTVMHRLSSNQQAQLLACLVDDNDTTNETGAFLAL